MRTTLKLVLPLAFSVALVSLLYAGYQYRTQRRNLRNDLSHRATTLAETLQESIEATPGRASDKNLQRIVAKIAQREHLLGVVIYDRSGKILAITPDHPKYFEERPEVAAHSDKLNNSAADYLNVGGLPVYAYALPLHRDADQTGTVLVVFDTSYIGQRLSLLHSRLSPHRASANHSDHRPGLRSRPLEHYRSPRSHREMASHRARRFFRH